MPDIPEGARRPTDHQPSQADLVKPADHPDGWELLRNPIDLELWDQTDLMAAISAIKQRGTSIDLTRSNLRAIGELTQLLQERIAVDSSAFRAWANQGQLVDKVKRVIELAQPYLAALGEADSSAS